MQTVRLSWYVDDDFGGYHVCTPPGDQSGLYVPIAVAERLLAACKAAAGLDSAIDQEAWYTSSQIPEVFKQLANAIDAAESVALVTKEK